MQTRLLVIKKTLAGQYKLVLYLLVFAISGFLPFPQIVTGTIVNCFLILAGEKMSKKEIIPLVMLPSLGVVSHGIIFGPKTAFLYYFLPFIWLGNYVLINTYKTMIKVSGMARIGLGAGAKYLILYGMARIYFNFHIVPELFITSMGYIQLATAIMGGIMALGINKYLDYDRD